MVQQMAIGVAGLGVGILIGVSLGTKLRTEIKTGFDNLAKTIETELGKLGAAIKAKL